MVLSCGRHRSRAFAYRFLIFCRFLVLRTLPALLVAHTSHCFAAVGLEPLNQSPHSVLRGSLRPVIADVNASHGHNTFPKAQPSPVPTYREPRFSFGIRGGLSLGENDLRLTTDRFPNYFAGAYGQFRLGSSHLLRPVGEWWSFSSGIQHFEQPSLSQTIHTQVRATVAGGEYLYRFGGPFKRLSVGGGAYAARWSVASTDTLTFIPQGTAEASGNSHWIRPAEGGIAGLRLTHRFALEGRWIYSNYGYERIPVSVFILGAGWKF